MLHLSGQEDGKNDQDGDGPGVDQDLHHGKEFGAEQDEEAGYGQEGEHQREGCLEEAVKVEVLGDPKTLFPDVVQTLEAAAILISEGFTVLPYTTDDPITAKKLEDLGCAAVMPLAAPIGSGLGIQNPYNIELIRNAVDVPVIVDAGVGTASDAAFAMELGCDGVLMNTAIAGARQPVRMARAMGLAVEAGRDAFLAGRIERKLYATASSPLAGVVGSKQ